MLEALKQGVIHLLGHPDRAKWLAPLRTVQTKCGWRRIPKPLNKCKRVLVIRPDEIGDVVLSSAFFRELRNAAPNARITVMAKDGCVSLFECCPYVDRCYGIPFVATEDPRRRAWMVCVVLGLKVRHMISGFDVVLLPRVDADWHGSELIAHLLASRGAVCMNSAKFIDRDIPAPSPLGLADQVHEVELVQSEALSNLEFLAKCGADINTEAPVELECWTSESDDEFARHWLQKHFASQRVVIFHPPGSRALTRRWPSGESRKLVEYILGKTDFSVVVVGGAVDDWLRAEFDGLSHPRVRVELETFSLPQLSALIRCSGYFIGGDSGPMHIAAAVGAQTLGIFGPGSEQRFSPLGAGASVVSLRMECAPDQRGSNIACCGSCVHSTNLCLANLTSELVLKAFTDKLEKGMAA